MSEKIPQFFTSIAYVDGVAMSRSKCTTNLQLIIVEIVVVDQLNRY